MAKFDFNSEVPGELKFKTGDIIIVTEWVNDEWMEGTVAGETGMFPANFVTILEEIPKQTSAEQTASNDNKDIGRKSSRQGDDSLLPRAVAIVDYQARSDSECNLKVRT